MNDTFLRLPQVMAKTGLGRSSIYLFMNRGDFPKSIKIGNRAIAWIEREVDQWVQDRIPEAQKAN